MAPTNFFLTNPVALGKYVETNGESLVRGLENFMRDAQAKNIRIVDEAAFKVGTDLAITPGRGYGLSVRGIAREIACAFDLDFVDPAAVVPLPVDGEAWPLVVEPGTGVRRFALRPVTGIDPEAVSPWWLRRRLLLSGIRPIAPAVDVTNYVMLELGHPLRAHDLSLIHISEPTRPY